MGKKVFHKKKLVISTFFAIAIAITLIIPIVQPINGNAAAETPNNNYTETKTQISNSTTIEEDETEVNITYAYIDLNVSGGNTTMTWNGAFIEIVANFTLTSDAIDLKNADAKIDFYKFHVYSEQGSILNISYSLAVSKETEYIPGEPIKSVGVTGIGNNICTFADGTTYDGNAIFGDSKCGGAAGLCNTPGRQIENYKTVSLGTFIADYDGEKEIQTLTNLRNAKTIYIEASKIASVVYQSDDNSPSSSIITSLVNSKTIGYVELTRVDNGFICGKYVEGTLPWPVQKPHFFILTQKNMK